MEASMEASQEGSTDGNVEGGLEATVQAIPRRYLSNDLTQNLERKMVSVDLFLSHIEEAPAQSEEGNKHHCPLCITNSGEEEATDFLVPGQSTQSFGDQRDVEYSLHVGFVVLPCCSQHIHRQCLLRHIKPELFGFPENEKPNYRKCPLCRYHWFDDKRSILFVDHVANLIRTVTGFFSLLTLESRSFPMSDGRKPFNSDRMIRVLRVAFYARLIYGDLWAAQDQCRDLLAALENELREWDGLTGWKDSELFDRLVDFTLLSFGFEEDPRENPDDKLFCGLPGVSPRFTRMLSDTMFVAVCIYCKWQWGDLSESYEVP